MKIDDRVAVIEASDSDLARSSCVNASRVGARFDDVNLRHAKTENADLAGLAVRGCNLDGMTIDGIPVSALLAAWRAANPGA